MSARTRSVSAVIGSVSAPHRSHPISERSPSTPDRRRRPESTPGPPAPVHRRLAPGPPPARSSESSGDVQVASSGRRGRGSPHSESLDLECACLAADRPRRAALRVGTPGLACCVAGWSPPGGRARSELVLVPSSMLAWPVSIELIDLPFAHLWHVAVKQVPPLIPRSLAPLSVARLLRLPPACFFGTLLARFRLSFYQESERDSGERGWETETQLEEESSLHQSRMRLHVPVCVAC
jgi:hypothetical protein